jgi:hypothetical protein
MKMKRTLLSALLVLCVLIQGIFLLSVLPRQILEVWKTIGGSAVWRGANFSQGQKFADYIRFLNQNIPENARVVLPPIDQGSKALATTPLMQFFLVPRQVLNCNDLVCAQNLSRENTYILIVNDFPGRGVEQNPQQRIMFDQTWGVLLPGGPAPPQGTALPAYKSLLEMSRAAVWPALWLLLLTGCGYLWVQLLVPSFSLALKGALGYGLGLSLFSFLLTFVSLAGVRLEAGATLGVTAFLVGLSSLAGYWIIRKTRSNQVTTRQPARVTPAPDIWLVVFLAFGLVAAVIAVGRGFSTTDEIQIWGVKGYGIAAAGTIKNVTDWGTNTLPYPLHIPILISSFRVLFGEALPASKILFSGYYLGLIVLVYGYFVQKQVTPLAAGLSTLFLALTPFIFRHATIAYANLPLTFYIVAGVLLLTLGLEEPSGSYLPGKMLLGGLMFAAAGWTRPEGLALSLLVIGLVLGIVYLKRWGTLKRSWLAFLLTPLIVYELFWIWVKAQVYTGLAVKASLAVVAATQTLQGNLHLAEALYVVRSTFLTLLTTKDWGVWGIGIGLAIALALVVPVRGSKSPRLILLSGFLYLAAMIGVYYIASYDIAHDISWWVDTGLDRMMLPGVILLWIGAISGVSLLYKNERIG